MHGSRKFCQKGPTFFLVDEGSLDPNTTISRPYHWPVPMIWPNIEYWLGRCSFVIFRGPGPVTLYFCDFSGEGGPDHLSPPPSLDQRMSRVHIVCFCLKYTVTVLSLKCINVFYKIYSS